MPSGKAILAVAAELRSRRGRIRMLAVLFVCLLAGLSVASSGLPPAAGIPVALLVAFAACRSLARPPMHSIKLDRQASPALDGVRGRLTGEAVTGLFVALKLVTADERTRRAFLFRDELEPEAYRALLAYLRHG